MQRVIVVALLASASGAASAFAQPMPVSPGYYQSAPATPVRYGSGQADMGGGFIEFLFGGGNGGAPAYQQQSPALQHQIAPAYPAAPAYQDSGFGRPDYRQQQVPMQVRGDPAAMEPGRQAIDPRYMRQVVSYEGRERAGTVIIDTPSRHLLLVQGDGKALRYGIGVGRPGFTWAGVKNVTRKAEWPDWVPPKEMLQRRPDLPQFMAGGPNNPLGARALYLGSSLYRIHGSNEPWTIGQAVSSGCIRMRNEDVIDLYERVKVGTKVVVI